MADRDREIRRFERVADKRLTAATLLLDHGFHLEAVYIAGYSVECALKSLILKRTPRKEVDVMMRRLTKVGARGHDFEYLRGILSREPISLGIPKAIREQLQRVATWATDLRYDVNRVAFDDADRFLRATSGIRDWAKQRN